METYDPSVPGIEFRLISPPSFRLSQQGDCFVSEFFPKSVLLSLIKASWMSRPGQVKFYWRLK